ncbi:hypothetical protein [Sorangium sp. So ce854]|uniref:hypothetical protein n=1 Tax=Sorangium sp. So ce854 TaxID=3133322 RepID=UPI003F61689C
MSAPRSCSEPMAERREASPAPQPKNAVDDDERERDEHDDKLIDLPPLGHDDEEERDEGFEELLQTLDDAEGGLDDANASDLEVDVEIAEDEGGTGGDETAEEGVDVGALHEGIEDADAGSWVSDESAAHDDDDHDDLDEHGGAHGDDGGAEGTGEDPSDDVDEGELPALDADQDGAYEGEDLLDEMPDLADDQAPVWDPLPWVVVEGAGAAVPCSTLAVAGGAVVAGGAGAEPGMTGEPAARPGGRARRADRAGGDRGTVLVVDAGALSARRAGVDASASSIALSDAGLLIATRRGNLLVSDDRGKTASPLGAWGSSGAPVTLATTPGRLWVLSGKTLWSPAAGAVGGLPEDGGAAAGPSRRDAAPSRGALSLSLGPALRDGVLRMSASDGVIVALTSTPAGPQLERLRGDDEGSPAVPLSGAARRAAEAGDGRLAAAAGGRSIALSGAGLLCVSRDGGETFRVIDGLPVVLALAFAGDHRGSPLLALVAREGEGEGERRAQLVHVPASGRPTLVAEIEATGHAEEDAAAGARAAIAWDASREVVWVACSAGLIALTRQRKH